MMDSEQPSRSGSGIPIRSGIPKPASSRLPLKSYGSQSQLRQPVQTPVETTLRKKASLSTLSRFSQPPPPRAVSTTSPAVSTLQRKTSRTSLIGVRPHTTTTSTPTSTSVGANSRASLYGAPPPRRIISTGNQRSSIANPPSTFKKPIARPPSRQTKPVPKPTKASNGARGEDTLGDLDAFRSASRASSRASSRTGFRDPEAEVVLDDDDSTDISPVERLSRRSRPSLSERTIESLAQLPSSPGRKGRRRSSFFNADNSMPPPLRPASAVSSGTRPTTSDGTIPSPTLATPRKIGLPTSRGSMTAPGKRSVSAALPTPTAIRTPSKMPSMSRLNSLSVKKPLTQLNNMQNDSRPKSMIARTPKPRPSLAGTFGQAISPPGSVAAATSPPSRVASFSKTTPLASRKVSSSSAALRDQLAKAKATTTPKSTAKPKEAQPTPKGNSSQTLREQIAKAKEAARRANTAQEPNTRTQTTTPTREPIVPKPEEIAEFDFGLDDPFNQGAKGSKSLLRKRVDAARVEGRLNIAAMGMSEVPEEVLQMYKYDPNDTSVAWGEVVDLTVIVAADNQFRTLPEAMFPDVDMASLMDSDEEDGPQFGALQSFDLHGNILRELPMGLRRLTQLSKLNLSRNRLSMDVLEVVCQITTLRELKLAENNLDGELSASVENLSLLEILEVQGNKLTGLPAETRALSHLRTLNVSDNKLKRLPTELFTSVPIVELIATKNSFNGAFFEIGSVPQLQNLQLANNSITSLCKAGTVDLPALKYLDLSGNRLTDLPDMSTWTSLATLLLGNNKLSALPEGFLSLQTLRNADFTANDLNKLDERIALMEGLENMTLAANPLRERKFLTMTTADIKRDLLARVQPELLDETPDADGDVLGQVQDDSATGWTLTPSGKLDLSFQNMTELDEEQVASFAQSNDIRQLYLASNYLTAIPMITAQLSFLSVLDISKNNLGIPLTEPLELPKLQELRLGGNKIQSLDSITTLLAAPKLHHLDVSNNRISGTLPVLRNVFPELLLFLASDNVISEVTAESLQGLKTVNLCNNDIGRLDPHIGRHAGTLTSFSVEGNTFRVPNYAVLRKGTEAILSWLRDKIPSPTEEFFDPETSF